MGVTRRDFVTTSLAGVAGLCATGGAEADAQQALAPEDGYKLWLRYAPPGPAADAYRAAIRQVVVEGTSETAAIIRREMTAALTAMLGPSALIDRPRLSAPAIVVGTPRTSSDIRLLDWNADLQALGPEGYVIRSVRLGEQRIVAVASEGETGAL